jgi:hypothetical protein
MAVRLLASLLAARGTPATLYAVGAAELTPARIARLFRALAARDGHQLVAIDEVDLVGRDREHPYGATRDDRTALTALLTAIDGIHQHARVTVIGTTSVPTARLDPALLRPGRLGLVIDVPLPTAEERRALFGLYLRDLPTSGAFDLDDLAERYRAFTGRWSDRRAADPLAEQMRLNTEWLDLRAADPRLPLRFLPADWPAVAAAEVFARVDADLRAPAADAAARLDTISVSGR